ncbi:LacI family DNA-binding transcriptional regulator [Desulfosporosinus fructosivorans]
MGLTIKDIAKLANVSWTTVSRVLNNKPDVKSETRKLILDLIEQNNFQPNAFARGISSKKSNCVGLIIPSEVDYILNNSYYAQVIRGISTEFTKKGYFLMFLYTNDTDYLVSVFNQKRVDGFIMIRVGINDRNIVAELSTIEAPFVSTTKIIGEENLVFVDIDHYGAASMAVEHLVELGHRRIGMIAALNSLTNSKERIKAFHDTLNKHNIPIKEDMVEYADTSMKGGYIAMKKMLEKKVEITAVFAAGDVMAIGAMKAIKEEGKKIPEDISIIGFDDIQEAEFTDPPLTTIKQPSFLKGKKAASLLIRKLENKVHKIKSVQMNVELIIRNSTANYKSDQ